MYLSSAIALFKNKILKNISNEKINIYGFFMNAEVCAISSMSRFISLPKALPPPEKKYN
jgi:hypothetical protein